VLCVIFLFRFCQSVAVGETTKGSCFIFTHCGSNAHPISNYVSFPTMCLAYFPAILPLQWLCFDHQLKHRVPILWNDHIPGIFSPISANLPIFECTSPMFVGCAIILCLPKAVLWFGSFTARKSCRLIPVMTRQRIHPVLAKLLSGIIQISSCRINHASNRCTDTQFIAG
jgi:hypothetical protein